MFAHKPCLLSLAAFFTPMLLAQSEPSVCQTVTSDQAGADGLNTAAIQSQLDTCGAAASVQVAVVLSSAQGGSFTSGSLFLPSNVVLWLGPGVTLSASTNPSDFQRTAESRTHSCDSSGAIPRCGTLDPNNSGCTALINACKTTNAGVRGPGIIEGHGWSALTEGPNTGATWWDLATAAKVGNYAASLNAPKMINFQQSDNFLLSGFTIQNAPLVHILLGRDTNANVSQLKIVTPTPDRKASFPYNSDGMDISGSSNIFVDRVDFLDGDDNIALEGGGSGPVSNITVTNSTFRAGHGLSIGSPTNSGVTDLTATNIRFIGTDNGLRIKSDLSRGGIVDRIKYNTICMTGVKNAIVIDPYYSSSTGSLVPQFRNVEIDNLWADVGTVTLKGYLGQPPLNVTLNNVLIGKTGKIQTSNANITQVIDPDFPTPIAISASSGVNVTQTSAHASGPADIKSYCEAAPAPAPDGNVSSTLLDDKFSDGNSQVQDLAANSVWLFNGRANNVRTDQPGSVTFDVRPAGASSEGFWAYFAPPGSPVILGMGDKLSVSITFSLSGFLANGQDIRFGLLDSQGTRNTTNLSGGMNDATFINDTGYGLDFYPSGIGNPFVIGRRTLLTNANVFNNFADFAVISGPDAPDRQTLAEDTPYTLTYSVERETSTRTRIAASVAGGTLSGLNYSATESSSDPATSFDYFAFRIGGTNFASKITFTELLVRNNPVPPVVTSQPQPSSLTVQVGSNISIAAGADGSKLTYQWQKDSKAILGNPSAVTPTLLLANVQHADEAGYALIIANPGGSVTTNLVPLKVSDTPVPPAPVIVIQPAATTVELGSTANLSVAATGSNLFYQWFKDGILLPAANKSSLAFLNAQVTDSGSYVAVIGNSSGSIRSVPAGLLVVSAMKATSVSPYPAQRGVCVDSNLTMQFDRQVQPGKSGRIRVYDSGGALVDTVDMAANPQTRVIGGTPFSYYPVMVSGNSATIALHKSLAYSGAYTVTVDPGVLTDASGAPYSGIADPKLWNFSTSAAAPLPGTTVLNVAADSSGDFCTVQGAIDFVPSNNTQTVSITVQPGTYTGITYVPSNKPFITVRGMDRDNTILQYPNNNNLNPSTQGRATFGVDASDFTLENITVRNTTPHGGSQAEAFRGNNKRILLNRVTLKSFQDTLLLQGTGFVNESYIEGDVDFTWGTGSVYFLNTELKALTSGGYYAQIRNTQGQPGNVYVNCRLTGAQDVTGMYLARIDPTVFPYSQVVFIGTAMGSHIVPAAWLLNNASTAPGVKFWESKTTDLNGSLLDVTQRASFSRQLTDQEAAQWSDPAFVLDGWVPKLQRNNFGYRK